MHCSDQNISKLFSRNKEEIGYEREQKDLREKEERKVKMILWEAGVHGKMKSETCSTEWLKAFKDTQPNIQS